MKVGRRRLVGGALGWMATTAWAARPGGARRIMVGQSVPLTGAADQIGLAFAGGAKLYFDDFNQRRAGWTFELQQMDDGYDAARAGANARKLLGDGADLLFGFTGTASAEAGAEVAAQAGAIFFAPFGASDHLRDPTQAHVFHVRPSLSDEAFKMVRHCATIGQLRMAVLAVDDAMGRAGLAAVQQAIVELKLRPLVAQALIAPGDADAARLDAAVASLMKAQPQAVLQVSLFNTTAASIRRMRKAGYGGAFLNFSVVGIDPLFTALGKDIRGVVVSQVVPSPRSSATPIVKEYLAALEQSDQAPSYEGLEGYIAAKVLSEAVRRAGVGRDAGALRKAMSTMTDYDVGGFRINLRAGVRDAVRAIDLVTITAEGKVLR